jgi:signal transduction histidine kinase
VRRIRSGKVELEKMRIGAGRSLRECRDTRQVADAGAHAWTVSVTPLWVEADLTRLEQMFGNLLRNAIKSTPAGGAIAVRGHADDGMAVIAAADTGIGIGPATLPLALDRSHAELFVEQAVR